MGEKGKEKHGKLWRAWDLQVLIRILHDAEKDGNLRAINGGSHFHFYSRRIVIGLLGWKQGQGGIRGGSRDAERNQTTMVIQVKVSENPVGMEM